jgi:hypothetical protein
MSFASDGANVVNENADSVTSSISNGMLISDSNKTIPNDLNSNDTATVFYGDLYIESDPSGATVKIDGKQIDGKTPLLLEHFPTGYKLIEVSKDEYFGETKTTLLPYDMNKVLIKMNNCFGSIKVITEPEGADVFIGGCKRDVSPCKVDSVLNGINSILLKKEGFFDEKISAEIRKNEIYSITASLKPCGYLCITSNIKDARIFINKSEAGCGELHDYQIGEGNAEVNIHADGYETFTKMITIQKGQRDTINAILSSNFGSLKITSTPPNVPVQLNGNEVGKTPFTRERVSPGKYLLKLEMDTYKRIEEPIEISKNENRVLDYKLERSTEYIQKKSEKTMDKKSGIWHCNVCVRKLRALL